MSGRGPEAALVEFLTVIGRRIRLLRRLRDLTQDELADAAGISRSFVSLLEHGSNGVDVVRLLRLAPVLGCVPAGTAGRGNTDAGGTCVCRCCVDQPRVCRSGG